MISNYSKGPALRLQGYDLDSEIVETEAKALDIYKDQDVQLLRGREAPSKSGKLQLFVMKKLPLTKLLCSNCECETLGRQWHNRLPGWGLCSDCVDECNGSTPDAWFTSCFGGRGVHFDVRV